MSLDANELVRLIKRAAVDAVMARDPMCVKIGEVTATSPLAIRINQKIHVPAQQLMLTSAVCDHEVAQTSAGTKNTVTVHQGLQKGDRVLLLRCDGGQRFIVLDRLEVSND